MWRERDGVKHVSVDDIESEGEDVHAERGAMMQSTPKRFVALAGAWFRSASKQVTCTPSLQRGRSTLSASVYPWPVGVTSPVLDSCVDDVEFEGEDMLEDVRARRGGTMVASTYPCLIYPNDGQEGLSTEVFPAVSALGYTTDVDHWTKGNVDPLPIATPRARSNERFHLRLNQSA
jgi:hypothetical protein